MIGKLMVLISGGLVALLLATAPASAAALDGGVIRRVQAATFEMVSAKPVDDPVTYVRPLPMDLLPFQERKRRPSSTPHSLVTSTVSRRTR